MLPGQSRVLKAMGAIMNPITTGLILAVGLATGVYGRHLETRFQSIEAEFHNTKAQLDAATKELNETDEKIDSLKKWNQDRMESLQRQILDLRGHTG